MPAVQPALETVLEYHGHAVTLRGSLRAAVALDAIPGGFQAVVEGVTQQSFGIIRQVILATCTDRREAALLLTAVSHRPLASFAPLAQAAILPILASYLPDQAEAAQSRTTEPQDMSMSDYLGELYRVATGWLGWAPSEAWNTSPREIEVAFNAHVDRLVRMLPGASSTEAEEAPGYTPELLAKLQDPNDDTLDPNFNRQALRALQAKTG